MGIKKYLFTSISNPKIFSGNYIIRFFQFLIISIFLTCSGGISGQTEKSAEGDKDLSRLEYTNAQAIKVENPRYPGNALRYGEEGWVILSYIVSEQGDIEEAMVEDSSGSAAFERAALNMLKEWKYKPALLNGEPVEQSMTKIRIEFRLDKTVKGASRRFVSKYGKIKRLINEKQFEQARLDLTELQFKEKKNLYEDAWFWLLKYIYLDATESTDDEEKMQSLRRAIGYEYVYLPTDLYVYAIENLYKLQVNDLDYNAAIKTFEKLDLVKPRNQTDIYKQVHDVLASHVKMVYEIINGDKLLSLDARIGENNYWVHQLIRRSFSIGKIDGDLEDVEIRCSASYHHKSLKNRSIARKFTVTESSTWNIPESWKDCGLYVKGDQGTTFTLYEYPNASNEVSGDDSN